MSELQKALAALLLTFGLLFSGSAAAFHPLMARTGLDFPSTMTELQELLKKRGYSIAHIQKCDGGLHQMGYKTDYYRVIFFGKLEEVRTLSASHPEMAAFLPLKIAVFAENDETVIAAFNPLDLARAMPAEELQPYFRGWNQDIKAVLADVRRLGKE